MKENNKITVIVPCYNEAENIPKVIPEVITYCEKMNWKLIVVNDGSKDDSKNQLMKFSSNCYMVINHKLNRGYGGAIKTGIQQADTEWVVTIDSDGQHNIEDISRLLEKAEETDADMVVGSRMNHKAASLYRGIGKFFIRKFAKIFIPHNISDINSGMKLYKRNLALKFIALCPNNMAYSDIILFFFLYDHHLVIEENISINTRIGGKSTISIKTAIETILETINIIILFRPMRFFLPISFCLFLFGIFWAIIRYFQSFQLSTGSSFLIITSLILFLMGLITEQITRLRKDLWRK
ncbi:MAG TPA: hypothetical protein DD381_02480 [Lentisphaeria bacterium]|nr:MAG: hypothetical protein A2X47_08555 [Lentisphaerae bacterium GWF2_38_69]HBM15201.1 hypothetical protein [Lentisphaeria bacterium]